jgi:hypothetical protein
MNAPQANATGFEAADSTVLLICEDMMVIPRLEDAARAVGLLPVVVDSPEKLDADGLPAPRRIQITEPLEGSDGRFLRAVLNWNPALIVFDLSASGLPWERWIQILSTSAATRRIALLAFGPHVETRTLARARDLGVSSALARGAFLAALPGVLAEHARRPDRSAIELACRGELDTRVVEGIRLSQAGEFFAAHEQLEAAVLTTDGPESALYRVLLQLVVAYLHFERGNRRGVQKMLFRLQPWLAPLPERCRGIDVSVVRQTVAALQSLVDGWPPEAPTPPASIPPFRIEIPHDPPP